MKKKLKLVQNELATAIAQGNQNDFKSDKWKAKISKQINFHNSLSD